MFGDRLDELAFERQLAEVMRRASFAPRGTKLKRIQELLRLRKEALKREVAA